MLLSIPGLTLSNLTIISFHTLFCVANPSLLLTNADGLRRSQQLRPKTQFLTRKTHGLILQSFKYCPWLSLPATTAPTKHLDPSSVLLANIFIATLIPTPLSSRNRS